MTTVTSAQLIKNRFTKETPWGHADQIDTYADGIISVSTPSHGGIWLSQERAARIPAGIKNFLGNNQWWEEDCDWAVPFVVFQKEIRAYNQLSNFDKYLEIARATIKHYHPEFTQAQ